MTRLGNGSALRARIPASRVGRLVHEVAKFGIVGAIGFVVDLGLFNALWYGLGGDGILHHKPLTARAISVVVATFVTYLGNRHWTWRDRPWRRFHHEYGLFFLLNAVGFALNLVILGVVNYALGMRGDPVANNVANVIGVVLGTLFRFWAYRRFVFRPPQDAPNAGERAGTPGRVGRSPKRAQYPG